MPCKNWGSGHTCSSHALWHVKEHAVPHPRGCALKSWEMRETPNYFHLRYFSLSSPPFLAHHTCTGGTLENIPEAHPCLGFWLPTTAGVPETKPQRTAERAQSAGSPPPSEMLPGNRGPRTGPEQAWGKREKRMLTASPPIPGLNHWGGGVSRSAHVLYIPGTLTQGPLGNSNW